MAIRRIEVTMVVVQLLATAAETSSSEPATGSSTSAADGRDMASMLDGDCIPNCQVCWPFERTNCCDPDNYVCSYNPAVDPMHMQDWCMPRNYWDGSNVYGCVSE
ncbi:hypothetical protein E2562_014349 [Oryza meyeriana var. granulata]|uniref:Bowman-Birk serine protease inhibitors family domain-containing protein n=1 Tax=Oryza meyeriana var. granulata TaxID=110450 RepID=A0A6G1C6D2_9ORYZ|nr:hypothetical protein E2562_014349 [Oryza meyeriana var. granulata]